MSITFHKRLRSWPAVTAAVVKQSNVSKAVLIDAGDAKNCSHMLSLHKTLRLLAVDSYTGLQGQSTYRAAKMNVFAYQRRATVRDLDQGLPIDHVDGAADALILNSALRAAQINDALFRFRSLLAPRFVVIGCGSDNSFFRQEADRVFDNAITDGPFGVWWAPEVENV